MKNIIFICVNFIICLYCSVVEAYDRQDMFEASNRILQLGRNQGDYASYSEMMEMYQDFRSKIKSDLELGNPKAAVDYELVIEGLVLENYQALQSVLGFNNYHDSTKVFSELIEKDHTYTQKLAYALKQNKIAFQTTFEIKRNPENSSCKIFLNGKELNRQSFVGPAGVPFYVGVYCDNYTFSLKKVQGAESQKFYTITFDNLKKAIYRDDPVEMGLPNPNSLSQKKLQVPKESLPRSLFGWNPWSLESGLGMDFYLSHNRNSYYRSIYSHVPILFYSSTKINYKNLQLQLDFGPVTKEEKNYDPSNIMEKEYTIFFRPTLAYRINLLKYKNSIYVNSDIGLSTFLVGTKNEDLKPIAFGVQMGLEPRFYLWSPLYIGTEVSGFFNFIGSEQSSILGGAIRIGADL